MGTVRKSAYRQPVSANGLRKIEKGTLEWFDHEMFANFNTGVLEQYLDHKNRIFSFDHSTWTWWKVGIAILIGSLFAVINQYVGLKVGMVVAGSWYIVYLMGMALKWKPSEINITSTASNGAAMICTGFVFTFPAIYLMALDEKEFVNGEPLISSVPNSIVAIAIVATIASGLLGIMYFIVFRRIWLVEDPLPVPGFEATVKLLDMAQARSGAATEQAKKSVRLAVIWGGLTALFTFLRDFPLFKDGGFTPIGGNMSILDFAFDRIPGGSDWWGWGEIGVPERIENSSPALGLTHLAFGFIPIQFGIGWFMKFKTAVLIFLGTAFTWFLIVPMVILMKVPIYNANYDVYFIAENANIFGMTAAWAAYDVARVMAIGCILGGGMTALIKMAPVFFTVFKDMAKLKGGGGGDDANKTPFIPKKGWYEWPAQHILVMIVVTFFVVFLAFSIGGFPIISSFIFSFLLVASTFLLGAIAVKVMGETGTEPVSATSFIVLLTLIIVFSALSFIGRTFGIGRLGPLNVMEMGSTEILIMSLIGTTVFGGAISMSGDIVLDFKNGLYCGNRPMHLVRGLSLGVLPGGIIAGVGAVVLSILLARGDLPLAAPQAHAFVIFSKMMMSGAVDWPVFILGIILGIFLELLIGMGTAFGLGMYLPLSIQIPMLLGGGARDLWEKYWLEPKVKMENWDERQKTLKLLETYMMATGLMVGEAVMGTIVAIFIFTTIFAG